MQQRCIVPDHHVAHAILEPEVVLLLRPVMGCLRATLCLTQFILFSCSSVSTEATVREAWSRSSRLP